MLHFASDPVSPGLALLDPQLAFAPKQASINELQRQHIKTCIKQV